MDSPIISSGGNVAYIPGFEAAVTLNGGVKSTPTTPVAKTVGGGSSKVAYWGDSNDYPQQVVADARKNTIIPTALEKMAMLLYGGGILYGNLSYDEQGNEKFIPAVDPVVDAWLKRTRANRYALEACLDMMWFRNVFPELVLSRDRSQVVALTVQETANCRWEKQDETTGLTKNCYISANWTSNPSPDDPTQVTKVPTIDPYFNAVEVLRGRRDSFKYIYPTSFPSPDCTQYQWCSWHSIRESGWLEVQIAIPEFKKALFKNQLSVKYHIKVDKKWWVWKYPDWESKKQEDRIELQKKELKNFNDTMTGTLAAGRSIMSTYEVGANGKEHWGWVIEAVDDKIKSGIYIEDSQEASSHTFTALGFDPTLMGASPGKGMGAGSGSDKNAAHNHFVSTLKPMQDLILEPFELIGEYNGWQPYTWRFRSSLMAAQTSGKPKLQEVA